ncbi:MAG: NADH-quinone oxidoreductase subunit NuoE [Chitinivibrionales bacterium]|nr:NADH-quinone oxidoreductase subunit NuoE [Chitinivibrionales bacterium]
MVEDITTLIKTKYVGAHRDSLIPILQELQNVYGFLSKESITTVGKLLDIPTSKIYGVASFYNQFRFNPIGKYYIQVCRGTACHVKGSAAVLETIMQELKIEAGQTTRDKLFTLEVVACIGACGLAPVMVINGEYYARLTVDKVREILQSIRSDNGNTK